MISTHAVDRSKVWMIWGGKIVRAHVPLSEMFGYSTDLRSRTQGRGNYSMFFESYKPVPKSVQEKVLSGKMNNSRVFSWKKVRKGLKIKGI